jgi:hypothetical protein
MEIGRSATRVSTPAAKSQKSEIFTPSMGRFLSAEPGAFLSYDPACWSSGASPTESQPQTGLTHRCWRRGP